MSERTTISLQVRYTRSIVVVTYAERIIASTEMARLRTSRFVRKTTASSRAQHTDRSFLQQEMRPRRICAEGQILLVHCIFDVLTCENAFSKRQRLHTYRSDALSCETDILLDRIPRFVCLQTCNLGRCKSLFRDRLLYTCI